MRWLPLLLLAAWPWPTGGQDLLVPQGAAEQLLLHREPVDLPPAAAEAGIRGQVRFQITVGPDGRVKEAHLLGGHPLLAGAAREAVLKYRFRPLTRNGRPRSWKTIISVPVPTPDPAVERRGT